MLRRSEVKFSSINDIRQYYPKRPLSPFNFFVKHEAPKHKGRQVLKDLGDSWCQLTDAEKRPYVQEAARDRGRYEKEKAAYAEMRRHVVKRPISGYALFVKDVIDKNKSKNDSMPDLLVKAAEQWKGMTPEERDPWNKTSLDYSDEYAKLMKKQFRKIVAVRYGKYDARVNFMKSPNYGCSSEDDSDTDDGDDPNFAAALKDGLGRILQSAASAFLR